MLLNKMIARLLYQRSVAQVYEPWAARGDGLGVRALKELG